MSAAYTDTRNFIYDCIRKSDPNALKIYDHFRNPFMPAAKKIYDTFGAFDNGEEKSGIHGWMFGRRGVSQDANTGQIFSNRTQAREVVENWEVQFLLSYVEGEEAVPPVPPSEYEVNRIIDEFRNSLFNVTEVKEFCIKRSCEVAGITLDDLYDINLHDEIHCHLAKFTITLNFHKFGQSSN